MIKLGRQIQSESQARVLDVIKCGGLRRTDSQTLRWEAHVSGLDQTAPNRRGDHPAFRVGDSSSISDHAETSPAVGLVFAASPRPRLDRPLGFAGRALHSKATLRSYPDWKNTSSPVSKCHWGHFLAGGLDGGGDLVQPGQTNQANAQQSRSHLPGQSPQTAGQPGIPL